MGIEWEDREGRGAAAKRNHELFDAPHVAFLCIDDIFGTHTVADVGMYAQTLMLAMSVNGIASCAQGSLRDYPDLVREIFGLEPQVKVLFGISFGHELTPLHNLIVFFRLLIIIIFSRVVIVLCAFISCFFGFILMGLLSFFFLFVVWAFVSNDFGFVKF